VNTNFPCCNVNEFRTIHNWDHFKGQDPFIMDSNLCWSAGFNFRSLMAWKKFQDYSAHLLQSDGDK
jgi:hypothetical protein